MKKTKHLFNIFYIILITTLIMPFNSCLSDDLVQQEEVKGLIIMNLSGNTRAAGDALFLDDELIEKVRFLVFVDGVLEKKDRKSVV